MQMRMVRLIPALLLAVTLSAQQQPAAPQKPASIRGQVVNLAGEPLRKAQVVLVPRGPSPNRGDARAVAATTDATGTFAFDNLAPGNYVLSAQRNGYVREGGTRRSGARVPGIQNIAIAPGQELTGITVKLTPHSVVTGKVIDEDGEPMYGAQVQIMEEHYYRGRRTLTVRTGGTVNDLGEYRVAGIEPGRYFLAVDPRQGSGMPVRVKGQGQDAEQSFVLMYYPGVFDRTQATALTLAAGQEARGIDLQVRKAPTVHIRGHVVDENGAQVANPAVRVLSSDTPGFTMGRSSRTVRPDGSFDVEGIQPGNYLLMANHMSRDRGRSVGFMPVQVGSRDLDNVVLRMSKPAQVTGVIRAEGNNVDVRSVRVALEPIAAMPLDMYTSRAVGEGNTFTVGGVNPGSYRVEVVGAPEGYYLKSVQAGGQDFTATGIAVEGSASGLEIILTKGAVTFEGTVADAESKPVGQAAVALVPAGEKRSQWSLFKTAMADQSGKFAFRNVTPGEYTLLAFGSDEDASAVQNPDYLKQVESKGTVVKLAENSREAVQLKVIE